MSKFEVTNKAIDALWDGLSRECHELALPSGISDKFLKLARGNFLSMLANFPQYVLAGVTHVADRTSKPVLRIVVCDSYKLHLMRSAKRFHKVISH